MKRDVWNQILKLTGTLAILLMLIMAACTNVDLDGGNAAVTNTEPEIGNVLRTDEVFNKDNYKDQLTVRYLYLENDVRAGDSILITTPDGQTMLIDAGIPDTGSQVVGYLDRLGIDALDVALNTHPHSDHIGGFASVLQAKEVGIFYMENLPYNDSSAYTNVMTALKAKSVAVEHLEEGSTFQLGDEVSVEVMSPPKGELPGSVVTFAAKELNDYSMVFKLTYKNTSFLFTADIYKSREMELLDSMEEKLDSDMVHAPHHGSDTSSSRAFVKAVSPQVAILSNTLFPSPMVMGQYEKNGAKAYATGVHGNILITSDGDSLNVVAEKDWVGPGGKDS